jgi:hypothetical protein
VARFQCGGAKKALHERRVNEHQLQHREHAGNV